MWYASAIGVLEASRAAGVKRLVLTHFAPELPLDDPIGLPAVRAIFPATEIARELMDIEF